MKRCRRRARATSELVVLGQLVDAQDGDDVLEVAVALEHALDLARHVVVLLPTTCGSRTREVEASGSTAG